MGEIVNLRRVKKQRARTEQAEAAAENRARHGRTKNQKLIETTEAARRQALLDQARIVDPAKE